MALFEFQKPYKAWNMGDRIEPHMCLSPNETVALERNGTIISVKILEAQAKQPQAPKRIKIVDSKPADTIPDEGPEKEIPPKPVSAPRRTRKESKE